MGSNKLRNITIYQIHVRGYSITHDFYGIIKDLDRIKELGVSYIYLTPIHPIGVLNRKGTFGSPYSILDYFEVNEAYGSLKAFEELIQISHEKGLKIMIDIVFNHTSRDSVLVKTHPDWFFYDENNIIYNRVGDWSDVADINYEMPGVYEYLTSVLTYYAKLVDGFRFDVASLIPLAFYKYAFKKVKKVNKNIIFLAESVDYGFVKHLRDRGFSCSSDSELFEYFDILYDYDVYQALDDYIKNSNISTYIKKIADQEVIFKNDYVKLHFLDNHDQDRIASKVTDYNKLINLTALSFFLRGSGFIYMGQEYLNTKRIDFFENDMADFSKKDDFFYSLITKLISLKKNKIFDNGIFNVVDANYPILKYTYKNVTYLGIFNCNNLDSIKVPLEDKTYTNILFNTKIKVKNNTLSEKLPVIIKMLAFIDDFNLIRIEYTDYISSIYLSDNQLTFIKLENGSHYYSTEKDLSLNQDLKIIVNDFEYSLLIGLVTLTKRFQKTFKSTKKLGVFYYKNKSVFRFYSPCVKEAYVIVSNEEYRLLQLDNCIFETTVSGNLENFEYYYKIRLNDKFYRVIDPYAKGASLDKSYIINYKKTIDVVPLKQSNHSPIIYEASIKDLTSSLDIKHKGLYQGLLEHSKLLGSNVLDYIIKTGVTYVQFMPFFGFDGFDDNDTVNSYNWGYNPLHFFSLSSYFTNDKTNMYTRINDMKKIINHLHKNNVGVCMDVVFNHVTSRSKFSYDYFVPGYFFRHFPNHKASNCSYCGNDIETRNPMVSKFIIDCLLFFVNEFKIDGFRFDLMGIMDIKLMKKIELTLKKVNPNILLYGEGWDMGEPLPKGSRACISNSKKIKNYFMFNDQFRDSFRGDNFNREAGLLVSYSDKYFNKLNNCFNSLSITQSLNYVSCHDNYTLIDRIKRTNDIKVDVVKYYVELGISITSLFLGIPFYHSGIEQYRTKFGIDNSYNIPTNINDIIYSPSSVALILMKQVINFRKTHPIYDKKDSTVTLTKKDYGFDYIITNKNERYLHIFNNKFDLTKIDLIGKFLFGTHAHLVIDSILIIDKPGIYIIDISNTNY